jgi:hypothetical protein
MSGSKLPSSFGNVPECATASIAFSSPYDKKGPTYWHIFPFPPFSFDSLLQCLQNSPHDAPPAQKWGPAFCTVNVTEVDIAEADVSNLSLARFWHRKREDFQACRLGKFDTKPTKAVAIWLIAGTEKRYYYFETIICIISIKRY